MIKCIPKYACKKEEEVDEWMSAERWRNDEEDADLEVFKECAAVAEDKKEGRCRTSVARTCLFWTRITWLGTDTERKVKSVQVLLKFVF